MARQIIIAGNWKMNSTSAEAADLVNRLLKNAPFPEHVKVVVFPPFVYAREIASMLKDGEISVGVQNIFYEEKGAFTGEISCAMATDCGCSHVLIGHSERRHVFNESDELIHKKCLTASSKIPVPVLCVGELLEEREKGDTLEVIKRQLYTALDGIPADSLARFVIAYEPVWAIGTGKVATPDIAQEVHLNIRSLLSERYGPSFASAVSILYGGSVKEDNARGLLEMPDIDGVLVGGASLKADSFLAIIGAAC